MISEASERSKKSERGRVMGVIDSLDSIFRIIAPLIGGLVINSFYPGFIGLIGGVLIIMALIINLRFTKLRNNY
jgi:MFS family permease